MAQGIRAQVAGSWPWTALLASAAACGPGSQPTGDATGANPQPRAVELAQIDAADIPDRVLDECHAAVLRGRMQAIRVVVTLPDGEEIETYARLPRFLRTFGEGGRLLLRDDEATTADGAAPAAATARLHQLRELLNATTLGPLYRAEKCERIGPGRFRLSPASGPAFELELRPKTLLPAALTGPSGTITIDDYIRSPVTWIPSKATHPQLGTCRLRFESAGLRLKDSFFTFPSASDGNKPAGISKHAIRLAPRAEPQSPTPTLQPARAVHWLVLNDPGDWPRRTALWRPLHDTLRDQDQQIAGFPILVSIDDEATLGIPFRPRQGNALPAVAASNRVISFEAGRELVVYPEKVDDLPTRCAEGRKRLRKALDDRGLEAIGPIYCQPWVHPEDGVPSDEDLASPVLRVSVRVR